MIRGIDETQLAGLEPALTSWARSHAESRTPDGIEWAARAKRAELEQFLSAGEAKLLLVGDASAGILAGWRSSAWDSEQLGIGVALAPPAVQWRLDPAGARAAAAELARGMLEKVAGAGLDLVVWRVPCMDLGAADGALDAGFRLADTNVNFRLFLNRWESSGVACHEASLAHLPEIQALASGFLTDHFHADPAVPSGRADVLYRAWLENSLRGRADVVLVTRDDGGSVTGFVTVRLLHRLEHEQPRAVIELIATAASARGRGLGRSLLAGALDWAKTHSADALEVGTQIANEAAVRLYVSTGFEPVQFAHTLHGWVVR